MLTRIEIDGFKSFTDFSFDVPPFLVILGPNAVGKSNLFDAIQFLAALASTDLWSAVKDLRGEPLELFRRDPDGTTADSMTFGVEVLLDGDVRDPWGSSFQLRHTRVRYEVEIARRLDERGIERLFVIREMAVPILAGDDRWRPGNMKPSKTFRRSFMKYSRRDPFLSTSLAGDYSAFTIHQDGRAGRQRPADAAEVTVLSSMSSLEFPHLYALKEELRSWRLLQLDPSALRLPSSTMSSEELEPNGHNLATVLARIRAETATGTQPNGVLADIAGDLAALIPGVASVSVHEDAKDREFRVDINLRDEPSYSSRVISDGTLRVLALLTLLHDPRTRGLVCFEEPENGIHPARLKAMLFRLRSLASDPHSDEVPAGQKLSQLLMNSHSPVVLSALRDDQAVFADVVTYVEVSSGNKRRRTRFRNVKWRDQGLLEIDSQNGSTNGREQFVSTFEIDSYLQTASVPS